MTAQNNSDILEDVPALDSKAEAARQFAINTGDAEMLSRDMEPVERALISATLAVAWATRLLAFEVAESRKSSANATQALDTRLLGIAQQLGRP